LRAERASGLPSMNLLQIVVELPNRFRFP
jgi:hypothetical protein